MDDKGGGKGGDEKHYNIQAIQVQYKNTKFCYVKR
jgi:hypothetical protein